MGRSKVYQTIDKSVLSALAIEEKICSHITGSPLAFEVPSMLTPIKHWLSAIECISKFRYLMKETILVEHVWFVSIQLH